MRLTRQQRIRFGILFVVVALFLVVIAGRLVHLQVFNHSRYSEIVEGQSAGEVVIPAARGLIYDRNGLVVAENIARSSLYAYPASKSELGRVERYVEKLLGLESGTARARFGLAPHRFRWIKRDLDDELAAAIAADAPRGLYLREENRRSYPFGLVGKQILGFTDIDNCGQSGLELARDSSLAGKHGVADVRRDGLRNTFRVNEKALLKPVPGRSVVLTADWRLQQILEEELRAAVHKHNAKLGMAVFLDCNNGDILAMAHFDPEERNPERPTKLRTVSDQFEPGSVFKVITAAGLLDAGLVDFADSVYCEEGLWRIGRRTLHDDKKLGWLRFRDVMELSSNIGVAKLVLPLGGEQLYQTARRFGMGRKLRIGLPGEARGRLASPERWSDYTVAALAMGHSVAVNAAQMAVAMAAIANGGELLRPQLILGRVDDDGYVTGRQKRELIARVTKESSADTLRAVLRGVVERGTATLVNSPVVKIAGKTGTAEIPDLENRCYFKNKFMSSFAGFFPSERPLVAGIVVLTEPHPIHYGGWTAGPAFRKIAERYMVLNPDFIAVPERTLVERGGEFENTVEVPDFLGRRVEKARLLAMKKGIKLRRNAEEGQVIWQFPAADRLVMKGDEILVAVAEPEETQPRMPDLKGLSVREASAFLDFVGSRFEIEGRGRVVHQSIRPGQVVSEKSVCRLRCRAT
ncbi:MAG: PASTA domain-containing protein [candidate division Zixibacteria bacterium]|nr:PASTA domain-containing protein [candidate division Zixibacteria bacterium]